jgi:hypothetical protein
LDWDKSSNHTQVSIQRTFCGYLPPRTQLCAVIFPFSWLNCQLHSLLL